MIQVIASLYYPTINVAIEYESAVFSISGTLRFSMSKDNVSEPLESRFTLVCNILE